MRIAHISDLHFGKIKFKRLNSVKESLVREEIDCVLLTGDITEHGLKAEWADFQSIFNSIPNLIAVPGNHDRVGDDCVARHLMSRRVQIINRDELFVVTIDSTEIHNRFPIISHGSVCQYVLNDVDQFLNQAKPNQLVVVMLHHHPLPLPTETVFESLSNWLKWPFAEELHLGQKLVDLVQGRCDLLLHGHKHTPSEFIIPGKRALQICNAGCTPALQRYRIFEYSDGRLVNSQWHYIK